MEKMKKPRLNPLRKLAQEESGVALTEFALVAPVLFLVLLGMLDFGRAINYWDDENHLAAEGARFAVVSGTNTAPGGNCTDPAISTPSTLTGWIGCQADTAELLGTSSSPRSSKARVCISLPNSGSGNVGDPIRVTVSTTFNWIPLVGNSIGFTQSTISGVATMRLERAWTDGAVCS